MSRKAKKAMAVALTAGMLASTAVTPVMAATQGWKQNSKGWWYQNADGSYPANKWEKINGKWYYFNANGYMLANAWAKDSKGLWYYVGADGAMKTNAWAKDSKGLYYWLTDDGSMFEGGWARINGEYYFFQNDGVMQSGVIKVDGKTYYMGDANQGWMQSGIVAIDGVEYNFAEFPNGACTDEKAPTAAKKFDGKGNLITEKVEVEEIDGITAEVINAVPQYAEYGNIVMAGDDATIKVKVTNNGEPVVGTIVTLNLELEASEFDGVYADNYYVKGNYTPITDANGYAYFLVGTKSGTTATTGAAELYSFTTTAVATGETTEGKVGFAKINVGEIAVNPDTGSKLALSTNAASDDKSVVTTIGMDGKTKNAYVKSQQVNLPNSTDHEVTFKIDPQIYIPVEDKKDIVDDYEKPVDESLSEYSVYENNEIWIKDVPAGLQYATLNFDKIDVSEYTKVVIQSYKSGSTKSEDMLKETIIDGPITDSKKEQLPVQKDEKIDIRVAVISEGQVDDGQNGGVTIKNITGVYKQKSSGNIKKISVANAVTWEQSQIEYSIEKELKFAEVEDYLPTDTETYGTYISDKNIYSYQVPVFPYVGNAIITVKDSNKKVLGYFTVPTENEKVYDTYGRVVGHENVNVLVSADNQAILVTKDEAFNKVGTITPNGNTVTVNSSETGVTALRAKLSGLGGEDLDLTNNTIYASVHWSPIPATVKEDDEFYALTGQTITVKAQLVDKAGNKASKAGTPVTFSVGSEPIDENTTSIGNLVEVVSVSDTTDENGRATLVVKATDVEAVAEALSADSNDSKYDVVLNIGDQQVEKATLRWVTPGLKFTPAVDVKEGDVIATLDGETVDADTVTADGKKYVDTYLTKDVGSQWILGYTVAGDTEDSVKEEVATVNRYVSSIEGLKVNITDDNDDATLTTTGLKNGVAKITTTKAGVAKVTGEIDETSLVAGTDVTFTVVTKNKTTGKEISSKTYTNVGEGTPFFEEEVALTLPVVFGTVGTRLEVVSPKGDNVYTDEESETVYVKVTDSLGNKIPEGKLDKLTINYTVTEDGKTVNKKDVQEDLPIENGVVAVDIQKEFEGCPVKKATVVAEYDNQTTNTTISFVDAEGVFVLQTANYDKTSKQVTLTFSQKVSNLVDGMITVVNEKGVTQEISNVKANGNKVTFTLVDGISGENIYYVNIAKDQEIDGITYSLCDSYGRALDDSNLITVLTATKANLSASYDAEAGGITFKVAGREYDGEDILCVTDTGFDYTDAGVFAIAKAAEKQTVKCYYNGASVTVEIPALTDSEIAASNSTDITAVANALNTTATEADTGVINLVPANPNGTTVVVAVASDENGILTVANNTVTVAATTENATKTATFTIKVTKGTGSQAGTTSTKTYLVTVTGENAYTVALQ